jgi:NDP-sugar pyrophosphorylase family protein
MRAMILAAGRGTRLAPFTDWRPKPALPVRGLPVIAYLMELLAHQGVDEVIVNLHHLSERMRETTLRHRPPGLEVQFSEEPSLLGTGGALRKARSFLRESDPALVLAGDMILETDLSELVRRHRERRDLATLLLRRDDRAAQFGTIGIDGDGAVRRIGRGGHEGEESTPSGLDLGGETRAGVFVGVRCFAARAFDALPERDAFEDLRDWLIPRLRAGETGIRAELMDDTAGVQSTGVHSVWEPVGTPAEYLAANLDPVRLSFLDPDARAQAAGTRFGRDWIVGAGADVDASTTLERVVVWDGEKVPSGSHLCGGVFAGGHFHPCPPDGASAVSS